MPEPDSQLGRPGHSPTIDLTTERLTLIPMDRPLLEAIAAREPVDAFTRPVWWPGEVDQPHLVHWLAQTDKPDHRADGWGPRALVHNGAMIGHAGFHGPPLPISTALDDPTFEGTVDPAAGLVVEVGYTLFGEYQGQGFATESLLGLIDWADSQGGVSTVIATVEANNHRSIAVLDRAGRFAEIGSCRGEHGEVEIVYRRDLF